MTINLYLLLSICIFLCQFDKSGNNIVDTARIISHEVNPKKQTLKFYWKDEKGNNFKNFRSLNTWLQDNGNKLMFAMNGGMYKKDLSPQGLYIEDGLKKIDLDTLSKGYGNFYLQPNGIFYLTQNYVPVICATSEFKTADNVKYATQSGPMLLHHGKIHSKFIKGSTNLHIRNGVGILPNGNLLFAISTTKINFYDFAQFFLAMGCQQALYLDGFVSRAYIPSRQWKQMDGNFGVIIAETSRLN